MKKQAAVAAKKSPAKLTVDEKALSRQFTQDYNKGYQGGVDWATPKVGYCVAKVAATRATAAVAVVGAKVAFTK